MTDEKTYGETSKRRLVQFTVKKLTPPREEGGYYTLVMEKDWTVPQVPPEVGDRLLMSLLTDVLEYEVVGISRIVGWKRNGQWISRSSDQDMQLEDELLQEAIEQERRDMLQENREDWTQREQALPDWLRPRIEYFREVGGKHFEMNGWGYELVVAELAALHFEEASEEEIAAYEERIGSTGHQYSSGQTLAKMHREYPERSMAETTASLPFAAPYYQEG